MCESCNSLLHSVVESDIIVSCTHNILLKFADFVSDKGCKCQGRKKEDLNLFIFEEATRIYQKCNTF